jgi:metallo-beta-lactamase class B
MNTASRAIFFSGLLGAVLIGPDLIGVVVGDGGVSTILAQGPGDSPAVTVRGQTYSPRSILTRNMGTEEDQTTAFPPHKIIDNIYYVGTRTLSSFLVTTPEGHILIDSTYERNVRTIEQSVTQLGFNFSDVKILLGTHAHRDHQEGDALVKELTGAEVMMMAEDLPALQRMMPDGMEYPIDRILHDGESVTLGGTTLVAHLAAGHTRGCTTWTTTVQEGGSSYDVVFNCSLRAPGVVTPAHVAEFSRTFPMVRSLPCDVPLGDHPGYFDMHGKHATLQSGGPNPFIDPASCDFEVEIQEAMYQATLDQQ